MYTQSTVLPVDVIWAYAISHRQRISSILLLHLTAGPDVVLRNFHAGLALGTRFVHEGVSPSVLLYGPLWGEVTQVNTDPPFGVRRTPRLWSCHQAQHLFPAADVVWSGCRMITALLR